jgi:hypothetical protein
MAGSALAALGSPAQAQLREAPLPEIFESYNDCFAATESGQIDTSALTTLGWARASMTDGDGKQIDDGPIIFGHSERSPIILLSALEGDGVCVVNARIASFEVFTSFTDAFGGKLPEPNDEGAITYRAQGHIVQIAPTGSKDKPSLRLVVGTKSETE